MIPATPGGLGLVQASLTVLAGPVGYGLFKFRYRNRPSPQQASVEPA